MSKGRAILYARVDRGRRPGDRHVLRPCVIDTATRFSLPADAAPYVDAIRRFSEDGSASPDGDIDPSPMFEALEKAARKLVPSPPHEPRGTAVDLEPVDRPSAPGIEWDRR